MKEEEGYAQEAAGSPLATTPSSLVVPPPDKCTPVANVGSCTSVEYRKIHPPTITRESSRKASQRPQLSIFQVGKDQRFGEQTACAVETGGEEAEVVGTNSMGGSLWKHKHAFDFEVQVLFTCMSTSLAYKTEAWGWRDG